MERSSATTAGSSSADLASTQDGDMHQTLSARQIRDTRASLSVMTVGIGTLLPNDSDRSEWLGETPFRRLENTVDYDQIAF